MPPTSYGARTWSTPAPPPKGRSPLAILLLTLVAVVAVIGGLAALVVVGVRVSDDKASERATEQAREAAPPATDPARVVDLEMLSGYCTSPGAAWSEVPRHIPGEPSRVQVEFLGGGPETNGVREDSSGRSLGARYEPTGGSTVISPKTDGAFATDPSVLARTRAVACIRHVAADPTGEQCGYLNSNNPFGSAPDFTLELVRNRFEIVVYELHSGGILHRGEIWSLTDDCPDSAYDEGTGQVVLPIGDSDVLTWIGSHFVDGKPA